MRRDFLDTLPPFDTEKGLGKISQQTRLYIAPQNWSDLAKGANLLKGIFTDCFLGAVGGAVLYKDNYYKQMLWENRELILVTNCVRLGAEHFARREARGVADVPKFDNGDLLKNIRAAHEIGSRFNGFTAAARSLLVSTRALQNEDIQMAFKAATEESLSGICLIQKNDEEVLHTLKHLVREIVQQKAPVDVEDAVAIVNDALLGVEARAVEQAVRAAFKSAHTGPRF